MATEASARAALRSATSLTACAVFDNSYRADFEMPYHAATSPSCEFDL